MIKVRFDSPYGTVQNADEVLVACAPLPAPVATALVKNERYQEALASNPKLDNATFAALCPGRHKAEFAEQLARSARTPAQVGSLLATGERRLTVLEALFSRVRPSAAQLAALADLKLASEVADSLLSRPWRPTPAHLVLASKAGPDMVCNYLVRHLDDMDDEMATIFAVQVAQRCKMSCESALASVLWRRPSIASAVLDVGTKLAAAAVADTHPLRFEAQLTGLTLAGLAGDDAPLWAQVAATLMGYPGTSTETAATLWDAVITADQMTVVAKERVAPPHLRPCTNGVPLSEITDPDLLWACSLRSSDTWTSTSLAYSALELVTNPHLDELAAFSVEAIVRDARRDLDFAAYNAAVESLRSRFPKLTLMPKPDYHDDSESFQLTRTAVVLKQPPCPDSIAAAVWGDQDPLDLAIDAASYWHQSHTKQLPTSRPYAAGKALKRLFAQLPSDDARNAAWQITLEFLSDRESGTLADIGRQAALLVA